MYLITQEYKTHTYKTCCVFDNEWDVVKIDKEARWNGTEKGETRVDVLIRALQSLQNTPMRK